MSRERTLRTSKNAAMLMAGTLARMVGSFYFVLYSANLMSVESFGKYAISVHVFELFLSLTSTAIGILLTRDIARWKRHQNTLLTSGILLALTLCLLAPLVMLPLGISFRYSEDTLQAIGISCIALFPAAICGLFEAVFVAKEKAEWVTIGSTIESLLRVVLGIAVLHQGFGFIELMWVLVSVRLLLLAVYAWSLHRLGGLVWSFSYRATRRFVLRWRVFAAENWMATIYTTMDVLVLSWVAGEVAVGLYSAAWKFVRLGSVVAKSFTTAAFPVMSRMYLDSKQSFNRLFRHTIRVMCGIALPAIVAVSVLSDRTIEILYKDEYTDAGPVLRVLIWVLLIEFLNPFLSHVLFAQGRQHRSMYAAAISLCVNSVATYFLIKQFGALGAAMACIVGGLVATIYYLISAASMSVVGGLLVEFGRILIAAVGMGVAIYFIRESSLPMIALVASISYFLLLIGVQALRMSDLRFFRTTFLSRAAV